MSNIQINQVQMPTLRELPSVKEQKVEKDFKFTLLSQIEESELQEKLEKMIKEITDQGQKLSEHMDIRDLKVYRSMISSFVNEIVVHSREYTRENFLDRRGRHRVYGIVKIINEQLDALAEELLRSEKNQVNILERIGEIQGLILDIVT